MPAAGPSLLLPCMATASLMLPGMSASEICQRMPRMVADVVSLLLPSMPAARPCQLLNMAAAVR
eukprot:210186-Chlamydomonas_euryale.AAC.1